MATSTTMLSSLVQTRSLELVLAPIASQVSLLATLAESRGITAFPDLMPSALSLMESLQDLNNVAQKTSSDSADQQLHSELPLLCDFTLKAGEQVLEAAGRLCEDGESTFVQSLLVRAAHNVLEGTMKILLVWDAAEVRKIIKTTDWVLDRLGLVQGAKSMRGLVVCYGGFSESLLQLLNLVDKRQKELTNPDRKQRLLASLDKLKKTLPNFTASMKNYVKNPSSTPAKESKDSLADGMSSFLRELIEAVKTFEDEHAKAADNMAGNILQVQQKLASSERYFIGPELDEHIDAIIQNSEAVAHVSRDRCRRPISRACGDVVLLRKKLGDQLEAIYADPELEEMRSAFDDTAEQLCNRLLELDRWVADAVVDQVTDTFVETSAPITSLVQVAHTGIATTRPLSPQSSSATDSTEQDTLTKHVELFRRHSRRLSEVATYAAQSSTDVKRVQTIKVLASDVDKLTPKVVSAAVAVNKNPKNKSVKEELDSLKHEWGVKVQQLTGAIDEIIDPEDFMAISEENIRQDMEKCRTAIQNGNWSELSGIVQGVAAKARRVMEVGRTAVQNASDPTYKATLSAAVHRLEKAIPRMLILNHELVSNPSSPKVHDQFVASLKEVLESIRDIQDVLSSGIDIPQQDEPSVKETSTPVTAMTAQERMMRKKLRTLKNRSHYIGALGAGDTSSRTNRTFDKSDSQIQTSPVLGRSHLHQESLSEGFSQSFNSGDAETQTPRHHVRDQSSQVEYHYLSTVATHGSPTHPPGTLSSLESSTTSWTTLTSPTKDSVVSTPLLTSPSHGSTPATRPLPPTTVDNSVGSYVSPLQKLVSAAKAGDGSHVSSQASALSARTIRLTGIAESAAGALPLDSKLVKVLRVKSEEVKRLTPRIIEQAQQVAAYPERRKVVGQLDDTTHQWVGHVGQLIDATQQANLPWSKTAERLADAAKAGIGVQTQMDHVSTQTQRMVDIATMTIQAAKTEEGIGCSEDSELSVDPELQEQIRHVTVSLTEITKLTPQLLRSAKMAEKKPSGSAAVENLNLLSHEWATKAKVLLKGVDDITLGMSSAADSLLISAKYGDPGLFGERTRAIRQLASTLHTIAEESVEDCTDEEKVQVVRVAADNIKKLCTQLIDCANHIAQETAQGTGEGNPLSQENSELLRRNWSSQVHFLTAHIDDLTAEVSAPLDHLVDLALQASKTSGPAKQHILHQFSTKSTFLTNQLEVADKLFREATDHLQQREDAIDKVDTTFAFVKKLTPHAIRAARSLSTDPGSAMLEHFNHLRRQWASKVWLLLANLRRVRSADVEPVLAALDKLFHQSRASSLGSPLHKSLSAEALSEDYPDYLKDTEYDVSEPSTPQRRQKHEEPTAADLGLKPVPRSKGRPISMTVPLPSWVSGHSSDEPLNISSHSIAVAAQSLMDVTDVFLEENNPIVSVAKKMSKQMSQMAQYARGRGELQTKTEMINTAKAIAANGQGIVRFANLLSEQCTDEKIKTDLQDYAEMIPTLSTQLSIIASVKASTPDDTSADVMLVKNAQNLIQAVIKTVQAAEAACMKGLRQMEEGSETANLAMSWKRKLTHQRTLESITAPRGARGLRKLNRNRISTPSVVDIIKPDPSVMRSPTKHS